MSIRSGGATGSTSDYETLRRIIKTKSAGSDDISAVGRIRDTVARCKVELGALFMGFSAMAPQERLDKAQKMLAVATNLLGNIDPMIQGFVPADAPMHVADAIRELQPLIRDLTVLVEEKKAKADSFQKINSLEDQNWYLHSNDD